MSSERPHEPISYSKNSTPTLPPLILNHWVNYVDFGIRFYDLLVHLFYFLYVALKKDSELQSRSCLFLHNVNLVTFLIALVYTVYMPYSRPSFTYPFLNRILCRLTELFWMWIKYVRVYSLLLLAFYRYTACCRLRWYTFINSRLANIFGLIFLCWVVSIFLPTVFKFTLDTSFSIYYCTDGFAFGHLENSIVYYVINTVLSSVIPTLIVYVIYWKMYVKLKRRARKLSNPQHGSSNKLRNFAKQFIVINLLTSVSTLFATFIDFVNVIAGYPELNHLKDELSYVRPMMRCIMLFIQSFVPVVSIYYTCWNWHDFKKWFLN